jgi:hypothetical protein
MAIERRKVADRLVSAFLIVLMTIGAFALWIVVPAGSLKLLIPLSNSTVYHLIVGLVAVPAAMLVFGIGLLWLNALYLRVNGLVRIDEETKAPVRMRGPLEPLILWSLLIALVALFVWFFVFAEHPSAQVI